MEQLDPIAATVNDIRKAIVDFHNRPETRQLSEFYRRKSSLEVLGIHRRENCHSRFLAWLLAPSESHGLGDLPIRKFLEACVITLSETRQKNPAGLTSQVLDDLIVGTAHVSHASVETEKKVGRNGRIDIYVECRLSGSSSGSRLLILIENKVDSSEHDFQTRRYDEWLSQSRGDGDLFLQVYLTPLPTMKLAELDEPQCNCKGFLQINYQYLVDYLIEPALALTESEQARGFLKDYLRGLTISSVAYQDSNEKGDLIMAISERERESC